MVGWLWLIREDMEVSGHGLFEGTVSLFSWSDWREQRGISEKAVSLLNSNQSLSTEYFNIQLYDFPGVTE
jgi:hypothetical protein